MTLMLRRLLIRMRRNGVMFHKPAHWDECADEAAEFGLILQSSQVRGEPRMYFVESTKPKHAGAEASASRAIDRALVKEQP